MDSAKTHPGKVQTMLYKTLNRFSCFFEIVVWRLAFWSCIDVIVVRVKVSRGIETFSPMGINSADTSQPPNGEIRMDKPHLLSNNPAQQ
jgi:hypothetical protein